MNEKTIPSWPGWETVRLIGRGSFGTVYEIQREVFGDVERAALKHISIPQSDSEIDSLRGEGLDGESITETFKDQARDIVNEYKLMKKLNDCPNVVSCDDVAFVQQDDGYGWDIFIKMELLTPLLKSLGDGRDTPEAQVIALGKDMCRALCECRKYNIIHRDIKPQNIFVSDAGLYKLGDFGIARAKTTTSTGTAKIGTYDYMAPEVFHAQRYDAGADLYSLGMVLYWLLNRRRCPFQPVEKQRLTLDDKETARKRRMDGEAIPAPAHGSEELKKIVLKACAFDPKDRYQSAEEMLRDLEALGGKVPVAVINTPAAHPVNTEPESAEKGKQAATEQNRIATDTDALEDDDSTGTVGVFGKRRGESKEDDVGFHKSETSDVTERTNTEAEEKTVGVFARKEEQKAVRPASSVEPKPIYTHSPKPKRTVWPILVGIGAVAMLFVLLWLTGALKIRSTVSMLGVRYTQVGDTLTISGKGTVVRLEGIIPERRISRIKTVVIEDEVTSIGDFSFYNCSNLASISLPASVTSIGRYAFSNCSSLKSISLPAGVTNIGEYAFSGCSLLTGVSIPDKVKSIYSSTFSDCTSLTSVSIPESVTSIGSGTFRDCSNLTSVNIPSGVTSISDAAFYGCSNLKHISLTDSVTSIERYAFYNCKRLTSISIPDSVTSIQGMAFAGCSSLQHIYYGGTEAQWNAIAVWLDKNSFSSATIHYNSEKN